VTAYAVTRAHEVASVVGALAGLGALLLAGALVFGWMPALTWALAFGGGAYAATITVNSGALDAGVPLVAAGLLLCGELAAWSLDERARIPTEGAVVRRRGAAVTLLAVGGLAAAAGVVAVAAAPAGSGLAWTAVGAAAAVGAVGLAAALVRRPS